MTKTEIFAYIRNVKFPYWELFLVDGYKPNRLRNYKCEDIDDDAKPEDKLNASLNALEITLGSFKPTDKFRIILKNSETANGSGIYGPVEFTNVEAEAMPGTPYSYSQQPGNLGGLSDLNQIRALGYVPESELNSKIAAAQLEQERKLWEMEKRIQEQQLKSSLKAREEELQREIENARKAREDADSSVNKIVDVVKLAAPPILSRLLGIDIEALAGTSDQPSREVEVKDAKYIEIEKLATDLYDSKATLADIQRLHNELKSVNYEFHKDE